MPDRRPIENFRFGLEWSPKLAEIMEKHPWPDSAFSMGDPAQVCSVCGRAPASVNHDDAKSGPLSHLFVATPAFTEAQIVDAHEEWRRRMANLPTEAALKAWEQTHEKSMRRLKKLFAICGDVRTRDDIEKLGCTGCAKYGVDAIDIKFMRLALAGSGVGLPCFVPENRYCLVHEVSGGLQKGQESRHVDFIEKVTRPLTPEEIAHDKLVSAARQSEREHGAHSLLHGHTLPRGWEETMDGTDGVQGGAQTETILEIAEAIRAEGGADDIVAAGRTKPSFRDIRDEQYEHLLGDDVRQAFVAGRSAASWKCHEHDKTNWACRYCVSQAIVEGALVPSFVLWTGGSPDPSHDGSTDEFPGNDVEKQIADESDPEHVKLYVRVATFTRKLSRD